MADVSDATESMKMVLQIIETHSIEGAEHYTGKLIDLLNSKESRKYLSEKLGAAKSVVEQILSHLHTLSGNVTRMQEAVIKKLIELERLLNRSLYESLRCMREIARLLEDRGSSDQEIEEIRRLITGSDALDIFSVADVVLSPNSAYFVLIKASPILDDVSLSDREKITKLWNGIKEDESFENFEATARENVQKAKTRNGTPLTAKVLEEFDDGVKRCKIGMQDLLDSVHDNIGGLRVKLTRAQESTVNRIGADIVTDPVKRDAAIAASVAVPVVLTTLSSIVFLPLGLIVGAASVATSATSAAALYTNREEAKRFKNRQHPQWFDNTENFLFDYIRGKHTDDEVYSFIQTEELEADLEDIRKSLNGWISSTRSSVNTWRIPMERWEIPKEINVINKEGVIAEVRRTWAFAKALLLEDKANIDLHSKLLNEVIVKACAAGDGVAPVISLGRMPDGGKQLKLRFVCGKNANISEIKRLVDGIAGLTNGRSTGGNQLINGKEVEFQVVFSGNQEENVRSFMQQLVTKMADLAELHVRVAMLGSFDISSGARLTNPAFNRTYGDGWSVPGFMPTTDFGFLVYSGEKYFCPNGWRRISINVASSAAEFDRKYRGWHVAYHGTKHELSATILTSGFIPTTGAYCDGKNVVYFSPSIVYASHSRYSDVYQVTDSSGKIKYVQMILQVRVNPKNIWKKAGGTLNGAFSPDNSYYKAERDGTPADPNFPENRNLEWLVQAAAGKSGFDMFRDAFVVYGIMIRDSDTDPKTHPENAWWAKN